MALSGWDPNKKIVISIPAQAEGLTDFPVLLNLGQAAGVTGFDCSEVFREISPICTDDAHWPDTVLAITFDGNNSSTPLTDLKGHAVTANGGAAISTAQSKFSLGSLSLDGADDCVVIANSADFDIATGDFTIETWFYCLSTGSYYDCLAAKVTEGSNGNAPFRIGLYSGKLFVYCRNSTDSGWAVALEPTTTITSAAWHHVALVRSGSTFTLYLDGNAVSTATYSGSLLTNTAPIKIGTLDNTNPEKWWFYGYINNFRFTKVARYTGNFVPDNVSFHHDGFAAPKKFAIEYRNTGEQCFCEIERWDAVNRSAQLWCKVSSISSVGAKVILYYDSGQQNNTSYVGEIGSTPARQVWNSGYVAVYHLSQDPSATVKDSTANARNLTPYGSMTVGQLADGPTGKALSFDGVDDYMLSAASNLSALQTAATLEVTAKFTGTIPGARLLSVGSENNGQMIISRSESTSFLYVGVWGDDAQSGVAIDGAAYKTYGNVLSGGVLRAIGNGIIDSVSNPVTVQNLSSAQITLVKNGSSYHAQIVRSVRISNVALTAAWLNASYLSDFDQLVTYSNTDLTRVYVALEEIWGLKMGTDLVQKWGDAPGIQGILDAYWSSGRQVIGKLDVKWRDAVVSRVSLEQRYAITRSLLIELAQQWAITKEAVLTGVDQAWLIRDVEQLLSQLLQPYTLADDGPGVMRYGVTILAGNLPVRISHLNIEADRNQDVLTCEIHPETEAEYLSCPQGAELRVTITSQDGVESFVFVVTSPRITEEHGNIQYVVEAMSPLVLLGDPWGRAVNGELSGLASDIARQLAAPLMLDWRTVDWAIAPSTWIASGETPLALIKQLAAAVGAVVQSTPNGTVVVAPEYPVSLPAWPEAVPDLVLTEILDCFTTGSTPDHRTGYNRYLIGDQMSSSDTLRLEEETVSTSIKEVRGYQTPWTWSFDLRHTGGDWVQVESMGIEERQVTETVEFIAGAARVQYPIYSRDALAWGKTNLGSVTFAEDGALSSAVAGESLLTITYTTRCRLWRVHDPMNEQLQLVAVA